MTKCGLERPEEDGEHRTRHLGRLVQDGPKPLDLLLTGSIVFILIYGIGLNLGTLGPILVIGLIAGTIGHPKAG